MIQFAVIGTNVITDNFLEAASRCEEIALGAVYSRSLDRAREFGAKYGVTKVYDQLEDLAADPDITFVYVASPNSFHCSQSILLMEHKKHVLCEKAIASNEKELRQMLQTAADNQVILLEAMRTAFDPGFLEVQSQLKNLGTIRRVSFQYSKYSSRYDKFRAGIIENAFDPKFSNGSLMDIGVYCVHALIHLFGRPESIQATCVKLHNGVDGTGTILAAYPDMIAELLYSKIANSYLPSEIQGEDATMIIDEINSPKQIVIHYLDGRKEQIDVEKDSNTMLYELQAFLDMIQGKGTAMEYNQYSIMELEMMDQARRQTGLVFLADQ